MQCFSADIIAPSVNNTKQRDVETIALYVYKKTGECII